MQTISEFIKKYGIEMVSEQIKDRPDGLMQHNGAKHYNCTLTYTVYGKQREMSLYFSHDSAIKYAPEIENVLDCIGSDCATKEEYGDALSYFIEMGYDKSDAKLAQKTWDAISLGYQKAVYFFGEYTLYELMYETERE